MAIKHFLLNFFFWGGGVKMCDKMAISAYILKIVEKDPFLRLQMRAKEIFNRHQFFECCVGNRSYFEQPGRYTCLLTVFSRHIGNLRVYTSFRTVRLYNGKVTESTKINIVTCLEVFQVNARQSGTGRMGRDHCILYP